MTHILSRQTCHYLGTNVFNWTGNLTILSVRELAFLKCTLLNPQDCCAASQQAIVLTFL